MNKDKELIERLAQDLVANNTHPELGFILSPEETCVAFLSAVDAERWKEVVAVVEFGAPGAVNWQTSPNKFKNGDKLFLAPQIPEGMANREMQLAEVLTTIKDEFYFAEIDAHHPEVHAIRKLKDTLFAKLKKIVAAAGVTP